MTQPAELRRLAEQIARAAADHVAARVGSVMTMDTKSSPVDMVTEVDREAEGLIVDMIREVRPDDGIVGEEGTGIDGTSGVTWSIDPIDGTTNFVYGYPGYGVSVAALTEIGAVAGAVVDICHHTGPAAPASGDMYSASHGGGATCNGEPIRCAPITDLSVALVATGFSFDAARRGRQAMALSRVLPHIRDIRRQGSAAVDLCSVASGRVDAYFEYGLNEWDLAAGALIAQEAGAVIRVEPVEGGRHLVVAAAPGIDVALNDRLESAGATDV